MDYSISSQNKRITLSLFGRFDLASGKTFQKAQSEILALDPFEVFFIDINFSDVSYIDSTGLGMLLTFHTKIDQKFGAKISLINSHDLVKKVIQTMNLHRIFNVS